MNDIERLPCPGCAEPVATAARICPHCHSSVTVDVVLASGVADGRTRYALAKALAALGAFVPPVGALQSALAGPRPRVATGITRAESFAVVDVVRNHGLQCSVESSVTMVADTSGGSSRLAQAGIAAAVVLLVVAAAVVTRRAPPATGAAPAAPAAKSAAATGTGALDTKELARRATGSTVAIQCPDGSIGSGFFAARDLVVTNSHVCAASSITVGLKDGRKTIANLRSRSEKVDLAAFQVIDHATEPLPLGDVGTLSVGDKVVLIGSPMGLEFTVHEGMVSNLERTSDGIAYVQIDAKVNPGNSGGPLLDDHGRVVAIVTLKHRDAEGIALAVPVNYLFPDQEGLVPTEPPASPAFAAMAERARTAAPAQAAETAAAAGPVRPVLYAGRPDKYGRLLATIAWPGDISPGYVELTFNFYMRGEKVCTLRADVPQWTKLDPNASREDAAASAFIRQTMNEGQAQRGEAAMRLEACGRGVLGPGMQVELEGGTGPRLGAW